MSETTTCQKCGAPAPQTRDEIRTLMGYGEVQSSRKVRLHFCEAHALEYDVSRMASAKLTGRTAPPPPSTTMREGAIAPGKPWAVPGQHDDAERALRQLTAPPSPEKIARFLDEIAPVVAGITPHVDAIALDDAPSRDLAAVWQQVIGVCYIAAPIPVAAVEALHAEYDRTAREMDPALYAGIAANVAAHREITAAFLAFLRAIAKHNPAPETVP